MGAAFRFIGALWRGWRQGPMGGRGVLVEGSCRIGERGTWDRQWRIG